MVVTSEAVYTITRSVLYKVPHCKNTTEFLEAPNTRLRIRRMELQESCGATNFDDFKSGVGVHRYGRTLRSKNAVDFEYSTQYVGRIGNI
jgi:hypothetical protein